MGPRSSKVTAISDTSDVLENIGVRAADIWLPDVILWVEGASEVVVINLLLEGLGVGHDRASPFARCLLSSEDALRGQHRVNISPETGRNRLATSEQEGLVFQPQPGRDEGSRDAFRAIIIRVS